MHSYFKKNLICQGQVSFVLFHSLILFVLCFSLYACNPSMEKDLEGSWKLDSVVHHYNQFHYQELRNQDITYQFSQGELLLIHPQNTLTLHYQISQDSLLWIDSLHQQISRYALLTLDEKQLILKEDLLPFFRQGDQLRYQLFYYSRSN